MTDTLTTRVEGEPTLRGARSASGASAPPRATRWEALLCTPGLAATRAHRPASVLKRATPLFVGAPVRLARSYSYGHGRQRGLDELSRMPKEVLRVVWDVPDEIVGRQCERLARLDPTALARMADFETALRESAQSDDAFEPQFVGRVIEARFDPYDGVVGVIAFDPVLVDGVFVSGGLVGADEPITDAFARLHRTGHGDLLRLSYVVGARRHEANAVDGQPCIEYDDIARVDFIDVVMFAATPAQLIRPLE